MSASRMFCLVVGLCLAFVANDSGANPDDPAAIPLGDAVNVWAVASGTASAQVNAIDFIPFSGSCGRNNRQTIGWEFNVLNPVTVTAMSWFDGGGFGLSLAHEMGIFDPTGNLIATTHVIIPAGSVARRAGIWRVVDITPTTLPTGNSYIIGGYNGLHTECLNGNVTQNVHPDLDFIDATFSLISTLFERPVTRSGDMTGWYGVGFQVGGDASVEIDIDVKPGSEPNPINLSSQGVVPVALLGTDTLDIAEIDPTSLSFGPNEAGFAHCDGPHFEDVDSDGLTDLLAHFRTQETGIELGQTEACLTGSLLDGTSITGCDSIQTLISNGTVHESARPGSICVGGGLGLGNGQYLGSRFSVSETVEVTAVGGHLSGQGAGGPVWGGIVPLDDRFPSALPDSITRGAIAATSFDAPVPSEDVLVPLSVTLPPGEYALVFGAESFELGTVGSMPANNEPLAGTEPLFLSMGGIWADADGIQELRFVVEGAEASTPVPALRAAALVALAGLLLLTAVWRLRTQ